MQVWYSGEKKKSDYMAAFFHLGDAFECPPGRALGFEASFCSGQTV